MRAFIGLGSNLGDRLGYLRQALETLREAGGVEVVGSSSVYETDPVGPEQPMFLNAVLAVDTTLEPGELLDRLKTIERDLGRVSRERWGPREVDLDLLLFEDRVVESEGLNVPHPEMVDRAFVLVPLVELAPDVEVPGLGRAADVLARIATAGVRKAAGPLFV